MTHIAIQEQLDGKAVDWMEKVCFYWRLQAESLIETWLSVLFEFRAVGRQSAPCSPELEPDIVLTEPHPRHRTPLAWTLHTPW
jgi:hypothetical protein